MTITPQTNLAQFSKIIQTRRYDSVKAAQPNLLRLFYAEYNKTETNQKFMKNKVNSNIKRDIKFYLDISINKVPEMTVKITIQ